MNPVEGYAFWTALVFYCLAAGIHGYCLVFQREGPLRPGRWVMTAGLVAHAVAVGVRWVATGHIPTIGNYENANVFSLFIVGFTAWSSFRYPSFRVVAAFSLPVAVLTMGFGVMSDTSPSPMVASLKSWWLYIHIFFAWLVMGAATFAFASSILYLVKEKKEREGSPTSGSRRLPLPERIEELIYRNVVYGFVAYAVMIASGALWAKNLWGAYWSWDPVETWSLISWLAYGLILHLRFTFGWGGRRMAWMVIFALATVFLVMFGINLAVQSSRHIFNVQ
jgi:cytochrome c-type biogenesis protein CcsB